MDRLERRHRTEKVANKRIKQILNNWGNCSQKNLPPATLEILIPGLWRKNKLENPFINWRSAGYHGSGLTIKQRQQKRDIDEQIKDALN